MMDKIICFDPDRTGSAVYDFIGYPITDIHPRINIIDFHQKLIYNNTKDLTHMVHTHYMGYVHPILGTKINLHNFKISQIYIFHKYGFFRDLPKLIYNISEDREEILEIIRNYGKKNKFEFIDFNLID